MVYCLSGEIIFFWLLLLICNFPSKTKKLHQLSTSALKPSGANEVFKTKDAGVSAIKSGLHNVGTSKFLKVSEPVSSKDLPDSELPL